MDTKKKNNQTMQNNYNIIRVFGNKDIKIIIADKIKKQ